MLSSKQLANNLHQVYFGGNWTAMNLKDTLQDVTLVTATLKISGLNTILGLAYHIHYYLKGTMDVLKGRPLLIRDKFSFDQPKLRTEIEWQVFRNNLWNEAKEYIGIIEAFDNDLLHTTFVKEKYGSYYRNFAGIIEHTHYHLGQIVILKKLLTNS